MNTAGGAGANATGCTIKCAGDATKGCGGVSLMEIFQKTATTAKATTTKKA